MDYEIVLSYSQIKDFRVCTQKHYYKYRLGLRPREKDYPLAMGDVMHGLTEARAKGEDWVKKLKEFEKKYARMFVEEIDGNLIGDAKKIMKGYERRWKNEPLEYLLIEEFIGPITLVANPRIGFVFKSDGVVRDSEKLLWNLERKTRKKFKDPGYMLKDLQSALYCWALRELDYPVQGTLWDEIRTKVPSVPPVLKRGGLSVAKKIDTDYHTYARAIKKNGLNRKKYAAVLDRLKQRKNAFYRRQAFSMDNAMVNRIVKHAKRTAVEILKARKPVMELGFACNFCEFSKLCEAKLDNLDISFMMKADFTRRPRGKKKEKERSRSRS